jgi:WhiB family redox-sensing transcriptional regulator
MTTAAQKLLTFGDRTWHVFAACRSAVRACDDLDLFYPDPEDAERIARAKQVCSQCLVSDICLDTAIETGDRYGIHGGLTEQERDPLHRNLPFRKDTSRVEATLAGQRVQLTGNERREVVRIALETGMPGEDLARILGCTVGHAKKQLRHARRDAENHARTLMELGEPDLEERTRAAWPSSAGRRNVIAQDDASQHSEGRAA